MNIILDLLVILIVVLFAFIGKTKGFVKTFFGFFGSIISFIFASVFAKPIGTFLSGKAIFPVLKKYFLATLSEKAGEKIQTFDYQSLSETAKEFLLRFQISEEKVQPFSISAQDSFVEAGEKMAETVLTPFSESIGYAIAYITLFIVFSIVIRILVKVFNLFDKLPIIRFSNHFLGLIVGVLWGVLIAFLFSNLLALAEPVFFDSKYDLINCIDIEKTFLVKYLSSFEVFDL